MDINPLREDFCGACLIAPLALSGMGVAGLASAQEYYSKKWIIILSFLAMFIIVLVFYLNKKSCSSCK